MKTATSTRIRGLNESRAGSSPPNWLGPVTATDAASLGRLEKVSYVSQSHSARDEFEIHTTTAELWSKRSSTVWCLPVRGKTTTKPRLSTSLLSFQSVGSRLWLSPSFPDGLLTLRATMEPLNPATLKVATVEFRYNYDR